ncbi:MAG: hypothetical protein M1827_006761 [Pycnora praestabilis]|nr:MAG: hypothetical protein M1827_006761 [Pycnora praestabilis]
MALSALPDGEDRPQSLDPKESLPEPSSGICHSLSASPNSQESRIAQTSHRRRARVGRTRDRIADLRGKVMRRRLTLHEKRKELHQQRLDVAAVDAKFMMAVRQFLERDAELDKSTLTILYEDVQTARDAIGPMEHDFDLEEEDQNADEYTLEKKENEFIRRYPALVYGQDFDLNDALNSSSSSSATSLNARGSGFPKDDPLIHDYLSRLGDAKIAKEQLENLRHDQADYLEQERVRNPLGIELYPPNAEFLEDYDEAYARATEDLLLIKQDLEALRQRAIDNSILPEDHEIFEAWELDLSDVPKPETPVLPYPVSDTDLGSPSVLKQSSNTRGRINRWLYQILRSSPLERKRHRAYLNDSSLDERSWLRLVSQCWLLDKAATGGSQATGSSVLTASLSSQDSIHLMEPSMQRPSSAPAMAPSQPNRSNELYTNEDPALDDLYRRGLDENRALQGLDILPLPSLVPPPRYLIPRSSDIEISSTA